MNYQAPQIEWQDQYKLDQNKVETGNWHRSIAETLIHAYQIMESMTEQNKVMVHYYNKQTKKGEPYISCPNFDSVEEAKEWVEQIHYPSSLQKAGFKPVDQEACNWRNNKDTDGWYEWSDCGDYSSDCGLDWNMSNDDSPLENDMNFCPKCGRKIVEIQPPSEVQDD